LLRRTASRKAAAATASGALALAGFGLVVLAPTAHAGTVSAQVHCVLPEAAGQDPVDGPQDITVDITPATAKPGDTVRAKVTLGDSPVKTPAIGANQPIHATPKINLTMTGGGVTTIVGPEFATTTIENEGVTIPPYEGDIKIPSSAKGVVSFAVNSMVTDTKLDNMPFLGIQVTTCSVTSGGENIASVEVTGGGGPTDPATLTAPSEAFNGDSVALSGSNWTPGATPQVALCKSDNTSCVGTDFPSSTLAIDASGNLSGTAKLRFAESLLGAHSVQVNDGDKLAYAPLTVTKYAPTGPEEFTADVSSGPVGTVVNLSGKNLLENEYIYFGEFDKDKNEITGDIGFGQADAVGNWTSPYTVTSDQTAFIRAIRYPSPTPTYEPLYVPFKVTLGAVQTVTASILPGNLAISQAGTGIDFGSTTLNGQEQELSANLNQVTVVDARSGNLGWSLTGTMTDLASPEGGKIPAGNVSWTPACAASENSPSEVVTGSAGPLGATAATLCSAAPDGSATTGGTFTADAGLKLTTPAFVAPGAYAGTLTLSLS